LGDVGVIVFGADLLLDGVDESDWDFEFGEFIV
jgi:hypothetical protein